MNVDLLIEKAEKELLTTFAEIDQQVKQHLNKVLQAFRDNRLGMHHFASVTGYGHDDLGRQVLDRVFVYVFELQNFSHLPSLRRRFFVWVYVVSACVDPACCAKKEPKN